MAALTLKEKLAVLDLYSNEIRFRLLPLHSSSIEASFLSELLDAHRVEELRDNYADDAEQFVTTLWNELRSSQLNSCLYEALLNYLKQFDDDLHAILALTSEEDRRSHFRFVLGNLKIFMNLMDFDKAIEFLKEKGQYNKVVKMIERSCEGLDAETTRLSVLLRNIPILGENAVLDLLRVIYDVPEGPSFVECAFPNFLRYYALRDRERNKIRGQLVFCSSDGTVEDAFKVADGLASGDHCNNEGPENIWLSESGSNVEIINLNWEGIPHRSVLGDRLLRSLDFNMCKATPLLLRSYQKELSESALRGENSIICAPTGSGKTVVAANIIKQHLTSRVLERKPAKVLFLLPGTAILKQQASSIERFLRHRFHVAAASGSDGSPLRELILSSDVVICTPQMIVNLLQSSNVVDDGTGPSNTPFLLSELTLMVFDECHNTKKSSPYSMIMQFYHKQLFSGRMRQGERLPQVVGLTASLGVGDATDVKKAVDHIVQMCARLDCPIISTVKQHVEELAICSPLTPDEIKQCDSDQDELRQSFQQCLGEAMTVLEGHMFRILASEHVEMAERPNTPEEDALNSDVSSSVRQYVDITKPPLDKFCAEYLNWVSCHVNTIVPVMTFREKTRIIDILQSLRMLYRAFELHEDFSSEQAIEYIEEEMSKRRCCSESQTVLDERLPELRKVSSNNNNMINEVVSQLSLLHANDSNFRVIIFVRTRNGAVCLTKILDLHPELKREHIEVEFIAGLNKGSNDNTSNTTKQDQDEKLKRFKSGVTKVLVSTSVAEEGLDIAQCNMVIKYNYASNEIAHVQRRGRARAKKSRCILITNKKTLVEQEYRNHLKESLMNSALEEIRHFDLVTKVKEQRNKLWLEIQSEEAKIIERVQKQAENGIVYDILCSKCDTLLCRSSDMRFNISQYCVSDSKFWDKVNNIKLKSEDYGKFGAIGKILCKKCHLSLGRTLIIDDYTLPVLAADAILLRWKSNGVTNLKKEKKWSKICEKYFTPSPLRNLDKVRMGRRGLEGPDVLTEGVEVGRFARNLL